uniref:HLA class II histocompatibility antigen, DQ beta 1 chain-like n=1 Tax=Centroberyx gerrardi TaxID=166262 RepID=UPI003AAB4899
LSTDGKYFHILKTCQFLEKDSQYEVQYQIQYHFNGRLQARYNSSTEKVVGFTQYGNQFADRVNKDFHYLQVRRNDLNYFCKIQAALMYKDVKSKAVPPVVSLKAVRSEDGSTVLVCSAYDFYPRQIRLSWLRGGASVPETSGAVLPGGAWRYQSHSYLEHTAAAGQTVSCMVEHVGLREPRLLHLDRSDPDSDVLHSALGGSGLVLGAVVLLSGGVFYWRRVTG